MVQIIPVTWYADSPIDFEHKQYTLLSYLQTVDSSFIEKRLSPHLLHMEAMIKEMLLFQDSLLEMRTKFDKARYVYVFQDNPKLYGENDILIDEIEEIINFSIPLVKNRIDLGHFILKKQRQVLY